MEENNHDLDYRDSHTSENRGREYNSGYLKGYYHRQWEGIEKKLLTDIVQKYANLDAEVLDFACGTGRISAVIAQHCRHVTGVDVSGAMLAFAAKANNITYIQQDLTRDGLSRTFDLVTSFRFFLNAEQSLREQALSALHTHLKGDGYLIFNIHMNARSIVGRMISGLSRVTDRFFHKTMSEKEVRALLQKTGFEVVEVHYYSFLPRLGGKVGDIISPMMNGAETIANALSIPRSLGQSFIVVARKRPTENHSE